MKIQTGIKQFISNDPHTVNAGFSYGLGDAIGIGYSVLERDSMNYIIIDSLTTDHVWGRFQVSFVVDSLYLAHYPTDTIHFTEGRFEICLE